MEDQNPRSLSHLDDPNNLPQEPEPNVGTCDPSYTRKQNKTRYGPLGDLQPFEPLGK